MTGTVKTPDAPWFLIPKRARLSQCVSKDGTRPVLQHAHLIRSGRTWQLLATDSYVLAVVPVKVTVPKGCKQPNPAPIPPEALLRAEKHGGLICHPDSWEPCNRNGEGIGIRWTAGEQCKKATGLSKKATGLISVYHNNQPEADSPTFTVALGADLLLRLAVATGGPSKQVRLTFQADAPLKPIQVAAENSDVRALLMPVRIND